MENPGIVQFIERVKSDEALRLKILDAEVSAARDINRGTDAITRLAAEEGFDIRGWPGRSINELPPEHGVTFSTCCTLTCCWVETSVAIVMAE